MKQKMKLTALICALVAVVGLLCGFAPQDDAQKAPFDPGCAKLADMTDEKVFAFLEYYSVDIPDGQAKTDEELAARVRRWIQYAEDEKFNPVANINYTETHFFGTAVYEAVFEHYDWEPSMFWKVEGQ
jgi:hypothetical protein